MKETIKAYENVIEKITECIDSLREQKKNEKNIVVVHSIERRLDVLMVERRELIGKVAEMREYSGEKPQHPSLLHRYKNRRT
ncbi:MAG: hypothetical protein Q4D35_00515 [Ruminococcus sp.]|nr:hypothetical protein [Ruminococcus sp.]